MSTINDIFDIVFVINLVHDEFKRNMMTKKLNELNINFSFIEAINGYKEPIISKYNLYKNKPYNWDGAHPYETNRKQKMIPSAGAYGYLESWLKIINISKQNNYKKILVFDDDVIFDNDFENKAKIYFNNIPTNFKLAALGLSQHNWSKIVYKDHYYNPIVYTDGSFALGLDSSIFDELIYEIQKYNIAFDSGPIRYLYEKYKSECFIAYPNIVIADVTTSSISGSRNMTKMATKFKWPLHNFDYIKYSNTKVSVILPVYNSHSTIELAIKSILNQTYNNIELIIIDDASTDDSLNIIKKTVDNIKNVKIIELKKNMGCYFAKNIGIRYSTGSFICFQDADDISLNNRIEKQAKEIIENNYSIVGTNIIRCNNNISDISDLNNIINKEHSKGRLGLITLMFKKEIFQKHGYFNDYYYHSMDQEFIDRIYFNNNNKLSETHTHELLNTDSFQDYKKLNDILYICQPLNNNNLSCRFKKGHKKYIRSLYLNQIDKPRNYIISFKLIELISNNFGKLIFNDANELYYLKYFTNNSNNILEINPSNHTSNALLFTKIQYINNTYNNYIITTNGDVKKKISNALYFKIYENYFEYINRLKNEQIEIEKKQLEEKQLEEKKKEHSKKMKELKQQLLLEKENKLKLEKERLEKERLEKERLEKERLEKEMLEKERLEEERLEKERLEEERLEKERLEKERLEKERLEKERLEKEMLEKERLEKEMLEKERLEKERLEKERLEKERLEKEMLEKEMLEKEMLEKERLEKEMLEEERLEKERLEKEMLEKGITLSDFIVDNKIEQIIVSDSIIDIKNDMKHFAKTDYKSQNKNTIFYGVYTTRDIYNIKNHIGNKWILWGGNDCTPNNSRRVKVVEHCKTLNIKQFLCVTSNVSNNLNILNTEHLYLDGTKKKNENKTSCTGHKPEVDEAMLLKNSLLNKFVDDNKINQIVVSESLKENELYKFKKNTAVGIKPLENTLFYGVYTLEDMIKVKKHKGKKWILWVGNDCNVKNNKRIQIIFNCLKYNVEHFLSINKKVNEYLSTLKLNFLYLNNSTQEIEEHKFNKKNINLNKEIKSKVENTLFKNIPIYVLNLKRRLDRYNFIKFKLYDIGIYKYEVFEAIDANDSDEVDMIYNNYNNTLSDDDYLKKDILYIGQKSAFAILLSYKKLINHILDTHNNLDDYILILEDDISFHIDIEKMNLDYDKDVIYLGANQLKWFNNDNTDYELINNKKYITYGAYGILYKLSFLDKFYKSVLMSECRKPFDYLLWEFIVSNNIANKVIFPNLVLPNVDDSDNMGKRDILKFCKKKKWDLNLYKYQLLELEFYKFYKDAYKFKSFRMLDETCNGIHSKDISRIIEGNNKAFIFIIASYNNEPYYKKNLDSILNQTYKLWRIIYIDDCSTDNTYNLVNKYIKKNHLENNFILLKNKKNMKQAYSRYQAYKYCDDDEIICFLDGDDWLYDNKVLEKLNRDYQNDIKLTYGSYYKYENNENQSFIKSKPYDENIITHNLYRKMKGWYGIPLRTGYASLYKSMPKSYLLDDNGIWISACTDVAEFLWGIEKSEGKFKNIEYPTYVYNIDASKRFKNSMYNLSNSQLKYRVNTSEKIFNYEN